MRTQAHHLAPLATPSLQPHARLGHLPERYEGGEKGGTLKPYVDGRELKEAGSHIYADGTVRALFASAAPVRIGALENEKNSFQGQLDEVAIWPAALSPEEIRWLSENSINTLFSK